MANRTTNALVQDIHINNSQVTRYEYIDNIFAKKYIIIPCLFKSEARIELSCLFKSEARIEFSCFREFKILIPVLCYSMLNQILFYLFIINQLEKLEKPVVP